MIRFHGYRITFFINKECSKRTSDNIVTLYLDFINNKIPQELMAVSSVTKVMKVVQTTLCLWHRQ